MRELSSLGLSPDLLHQLLEAQEPESSGDLEASACSVYETSPSTVNLPLDDGTSHTGNCCRKVVYEFVESSSKIEPQLRLPLETLRELASSLRAGTVTLEETAEGSVDHAGRGSDEDLDLSVAEPSNSLILPGNTLLWSLQNPALEYVLPQPSFLSCALTHFVEKLRQFPTSRCALEFLS